MITTPGPKGVTGELVTPTGASLIRALCGLPSLLSSTPDAQTTHAQTPSHRQGVLPPHGFQIRSIGVGAGTKDFAKHPNIVRVMIGELPGTWGTSATTLTSVPSNRPPTAPVLPIIVNVPDSGDRADRSTVNLSAPLAVQTAAAMPVADHGDGDSLWEMQDMLLLQCNIDDMTAELLGNLLEGLLAAGARDAWLENIGMKKNRSSASMLSVLCFPEEK